MRGLHEVLEHVLSVGRAKLELSEVVEERVVDLVDTDRDESVLPGATAHLLDIRLSPFVCLFDPLGMDPAVQYEIFESDPSDLPAERVEAGEQNRLGSVVDDHVDAGDRFERSD